MDVTLKMQITNGGLQARMIDMINGASSGFVSH
jgi:hypothetical protein